MPRPLAYVCVGCLWLGLGCAADEMDEALSQATYGVGSLEDFMTEMDQDKDGCLVPQEVFNVQKIERETSQAWVIDHFRKADADGDGKICAKELPDMLKTINDEPEGYHHLLPDGISEEPPEAHQSSLLDDEGSANSALETSSWSDAEYSMLRKIEEAEWNSLTVDAIMKRFDHDKDGSFNADDIGKAGIDNGDSEKVLEKLHSEFRKADANGDGMISREELEKSIPSIQRAFPELQNKASLYSNPASLIEDMMTERWSARPQGVMQKLDTDGDGYLAADEVMSEHMSGSLKDRAHQFKVADVDGNGKVSLQELTDKWSALQDMPNPEPDEDLGSEVQKESEPVFLEDPAGMSELAIEFFDTDKDGSLSSEEALAAGKNLDTEYEAWIGKRFPKADANGDWKLDSDELQKMLAKFRYKDEGVYLMGLYKKHLAQTQVQ